MRYKIPTCKDPTDPSCLYMRNLFREWFWGPFKDEQALIDAIKILDKFDPHWDEDPFCIIYGSNPLPTDYVFGFKSVSGEVRERIESSRVVKVGVKRKGVDSTGLRIPIHLSKQPNEDQRSIESVYIGRMCDRCGKRKAMHIVTKWWEKPQDRFLCCYCYVEEGHAPANWHPDCMKAYKEKTGED